MAQSVMNDSIHNWIKFSNEMKSLKNELMEIKEMLEDLELDPLDLKDNLE